MSEDRGHVGHVDFSDFIDPAPGPEECKMLDALHEGMMRDLLTPKPGEHVNVYRNHDNGDESIVITDENGQKRGHARYTFIGTLRKGTL
jgi:hypothetical protein